MSVAVAVLGGAAVGAVFAALAASSSGSKPTSHGSDGAPATLPPAVVPPKPAGAPFAKVSSRPVWPLRTRHPRRSVVSYRGTDGKVRGNWARRFGAPRTSDRGNRRHAGIDLFAFAGDEVLAVADGTLVAVQSFHLGSWAVFIDHGPVTVMYGEVAKGSWGRFGLAVGAKVVAGQPIAEVACMRHGDDGRCTSHMLHLETYKPGTTRNQRWYADQDAPDALLDPSLLLLIASQEAATPPNMA